MTWFTPGEKADFSDFYIRQFEYWEYDVFIPTNFQETWENFGFPSFEGTTEGWETFGFPSFFGPTETWESD